MGLQIRFPKELSSQQGCADKGCAYTKGRLYMQLYVRRHYFFPPGRITQYYDDVTSQVRAETQVS